MKTLIVFAKAPVEGLVKTRLFEQTPLDEFQVLTLYTAFLKDILTVATLSGAETIALHYTPEHEDETMRKLVSGLKTGARNERRFVFAPQEGGTFAERITNSFKNASRAGFGELVMIGSDSPLLTPDIIDSAFEFIHLRSGMALGPSGEGGVYLIGFNSDAPVRFDRVFSEGSEIENLCAIAKSGNMPLFILPETLDVDVESDLVGLVGIIKARSYSRRFEDGFFPLHTAEAIDNLKVRIVRRPGNTRDKKIVLSND